MKEFLSRAEFLSEAMAVTVFSTQMGQRNFGGESKDDLGGTLARAQIRKSFRIAAIHSFVMIWAKVEVIR